MKKMWKSMTAFMMALLLVIGLIPASLQVNAEESTSTKKARTVVTTDGEVDDQDSFMRLMLYANEMDIEGLILTSSTYHYAGGEMADGTVVEPYRWTGTEWPTEVLERYAEVYDNLNANAEGYPTPEYLESILKIGNIKNVGDMEEPTVGSNFLKKIILEDAQDNDERPLYIQTWGGTNTTARALLDIENEYKDSDEWEEIYQKICDKIVIYIILNQDDTFSNYIAKAWPDIKIIQDGGNFWRFAYMWKRVDESLTTRLQGKWNYNNIQKGHGPLLEGYHLMGDGTTLPGELDNEQRGWEEYLIRNPQYNRYDFISEGDSPSFFYLLDTGLRSMEDPTYGGWGGRFGEDSDGNFRNIVSDVFNGQNDTTYTLTRWFDDIQDDFAARADWCVKSYADANHRPTVSVDNLDLTAAPGERVKIKAKADDPDGDSLDYKWWQYFEADTYDGVEDGAISMIGASTDTMSFKVPEDAKNGDTIHMVIEVEDDGAHGMKHYQRVIITVDGREEISELTVTAPVDTDINNLAYEESIRQGWGGPQVVQPTVQLTANAKDTEGNTITSGKTYTWKSDNEKIATVNASSGLVTLKGATGKVTITAMVNDGTKKAASIDLTVTSTTKEETPEVPETPEEKPEQKPQDTTTPSSDTNSVQQPAALPTTGTVLNDSKASYQVTVPGAEVAYKAPVNKKAKTVSVPATVTFDGVTYKVTSIGAKAFKDNKKITKVIIGSNVKEIGKNAFNNCKYLKSVIIKTKLLTKKTVGKNAFKKAGSSNYKKLTVKTPTKKKKAYTNILRSRGLNKNAKIK